MATIVARPRKDGTIGYTAQIKIKREGRVVFSQAQTFDREAAAQAWVKKKEAALAKPGGLEAATKPKGTLSDALDRYVGLFRKDIGRTKEQVLLALKGYDIAQKGLADINAADVLDLARELGNGRKPQTVQNYLSHLSAVFSVARATWRVDIDRNVMRDAMEAAKHFGMVAKSAKRDRRPTVDEMTRLMMHFEAKTRRRNSMPMQRVVGFALFSTRRQEEITRIRWDDLEEGRVLVRDMKHPGDKMGNDTWCGLPPEAEAIARAMPKVAAEIFPFSTDAISAAFTRACQTLGIEDLHFHDLRHEGASRLFELGWTIPRVAEVTGHRTWQSLQRYTHLRQTGDKWAGWVWTDLMAQKQS
jgi:integrase